MNLSRAEINKLVFERVNLCIPGLNEKDKCDVLASNRVSPETTTPQKPNMNEPVMGTNTTNSTESNNVVQGTNMSIPSDSTPAVKGINQLDPKPDTPSNEYAETVETNTNIKPKLQIVADKISTQSVPTVDDIDTDTDTIIMSDTTTETMTSPKTTNTKNIKPTIGVNAFGHHKR